jgi:hypothetical protein
LEACANFKPKTYNLQLKTVSMRGDQARQNPFDIRRLDLAPLNEVVRPVLDQDNPTKGCPQKNDKPSQQTQ